MPTQPRAPRVATSSGGTAGGPVELSAASAQPESSAQAPRTLTVDILWGPACIASTAAAVVDALRAMNAVAAMRGDGQARLAWRWLALPGPAGEAPPVPASARTCDARPPAPGTSAASDTVTAPNVLVIPGWVAGSGPQLRGLCAQAMACAEPLLKVHLAQGGRVLALFNGSALLADLGLLAGRSVALPWAYAPSIHHQANERLHWLRDRAWHGDGTVWSTAALAQTIEAFLDLLADTSVADLAQAAAPVLCYEPQHQLTASAAIESPTGRHTPVGALEQARRWLQSHRNEPYSLQATARAAATSPRTLLRWFAQIDGQTPQDYLHGLRVAQAQTLLQTSYLSVEAIAQECGYADAASLRRIFVRHTGSTPAAWRSSHRLRTSRKQWGEVPGHSPRPAQ